MKKIMLSLLLFLVFFCFSSAAQSLERYDKMTELSQLPPLIVFDRNGNETDLSKSRYLAIDFYCGWCKPCKYHVRYLNKAAGDFLEDFGDEYTIGAALTGSLEPVPVAVIIGVASKDKMKEEYEFFENNGLTGLSVYYMLEQDLWKYISEDKFPKAVPTTIYRFRNVYKIGSGVKKDIAVYNMLQAIFLQ